MTAPKIKTLTLDSTDLTWLSEKIAHLERGNFETQTASVKATYLDHTFNFKRRGGDECSDLVLVLKVAG